MKVEVPAAYVKTSEQADPVSRQELLVAGVALGPVGRCRLVLSLQSWSVGYSVWRGFSAEAGTSVHWRA